MVGDPFDPQQAISSAFDDWLIESWPRAKLAFKRAMTGTEDQQAVAARTLAGFVHDLSGIAAVAGNSAMGEIANAVAEHGRSAGMPATSMDRQELQRLWRGLSQAIELYLAHRHSHNEAPVRHTPSPHQ